MGITNIWRGNIFSYRNKHDDSPQFYFPTTGLLLEPFRSDICLCYNDTRCRNCSSIAIVNREKYQIINVRAGGSKHVTNFETGSDGKSHKAMREDLIK